mgnify:CR=1 FL=1
MAVKVRIPTILRTYTDGASEVAVEPSEPTLAALLDALDAAAPGIGARVLDVCSYAGAWAVTTMKGGASSATSASAADRPSPRAPPVTT